MCRATLVAVALVALTACSSDPQPAGWLGTPSDAGRPDAFDIDSAYPTADPDPDGGTREGPTFGADGGAPAPATCAPGLPGKAGDSTISVKAGGRTRTALVHVPPGYDPTKGTMLVLNFHGFGSADWQQRLLTRMNPASDAHGFIVAYPAGVASSWNAGQCCGTAWTDSVDDVAFVKALLAKLESTWCIDRKHVHATGMSNGGFFSHRLACEMADTFASVAPVAGVLGIEPSVCKPSRPIAVLDIHGTADGVVPYSGGTPILPVDLGPVLDFRSVPDTVNVWRQKNGCLGAPATIFQKGDATCTAYGGCLSGVEVVHCAIDGGGHTWPGGVPVPWLGKTSTSMSATETMISFFEAHPLP